MKHKPVSVGGSHDPEGPLARLLQDEIAGLRVLDRDFVIALGPPERRADWLGVDRDGRLVLVLFVEIGDEVVATTVLTALASATEARAAAARRWSGERLRTDSEPCVVVVAQSFTTRGLRGLSFLDSPHVIALELRTLESAAGAQPFLIRRTLSAQSAAATVDPQPFSTWPAITRAEIGLLAHAIERIDPEIERRDTADASSWHWQGVEIAHATSADGRLVARAEHSPTAVPFDETARRELWVEQFLIAHCARRAGATPGARPLDVLDRSAGPLLSAEELAAFQD
ncbi:MAG: hypothetical protein JNL28_04265 [Planctomycetes bacterium]|nr:hypothetical protein [Planctomycetota bacterium]